LAFVSSLDVLLGTGAGADMYPHHKGGKFIYISKIFFFFWVLLKWEGMWALWFVKPESARASPEGT